MIIKVVVVVQCNVNWSQRIGKENRFRKIRILILLEGGRHKAPKEMEMESVIFLQTKKHKGNLKNWCYKIRVATCLVFFWSRVSITTTRNAPYPRNVLMPTVVQNWNGLQVSILENYKWLSHLKAWNKHSVYIYRETLQNYMSKKT